MPRVEAESLDLPRGPNGELLPHLVLGLVAWLGIPRHRAMCVDFISKAMQKSLARHDRLLRPNDEVVVEAPLATYSLIHVCGVNKFGHVISSVPPGRYSSLFIGVRWSCHFLSGRGPGV